jgi:hypothetical protein
MAFPVKQSFVPREPGNLDNLMCMLVIFACLVDESMKLLCVTVLDSNHKT